MGQGLMCSALPRCASAADGTLTSTPRSVRASMMPSASCLSIKGTYLLRCDWNLASATNLPAWTVAMSCRKSEMPAQVRPPPLFWMRASLCPPVPNRNFKAYSKSGPQNDAVLCCFFLISLQLLMQTEKYYPIHARTAHQGPPAEGRGSAP